MSDFEKWFKTTEAYKMLEEQNYFKMDLFFFVGARNQYRHSGVQVAYLTWQHQQAIIDEHTEVIKLQDADLRKYEKQIESLKAQLAVYKEDMTKDAEKIVELTNKIEKPCRWCGFENKRGAND